MKYVQAILAIGLFGYFGFAVLTESLPLGDAGSSKSRALKTAVDAATETFGATGTAFGLFAVGLALAVLCLRRRDYA